MKEVNGLKLSIHSCIACPKVLKFDLITNPDIVIFN